jgi:acetyl esterase
MVTVVSSSHPWTPNCKGGNTVSILSGNDCFEKLAPEVKAFLKRTADAPEPPLSRETYLGARRFVENMAKKTKPPALPIKRIEDVNIPGPSGKIPVRIYTPEGDGPFPVLLLFHGGGWVVGNLDMEHHVCLILAYKTPCIVVSVDYRLAPEHPFPAAPEDCYAAFEWIATQADSFEGDGERIALCGESAGANLAAAVTLMSKNRRGPSAVLQVLFNPVTNIAELDSESHRVFGEGFMLTRADMEGTRSMYVPDEKDRRNPYASPLLADDLKGLPPALIITAGCDPLRDDGEAYANRLKEAGVPVKYTCYEDMIHGFVYFFKNSESSRKALEEAASALKDAFGQQGDSGR